MLKHRLHAVFEHKMTYLIFWHKVCGFTNDILFKFYHLRIRFFWKYQVKNNVNSCSFLKHLMETLFLLYILISPFSICTQQKARDIRRVLFLIPSFGWKLVKPPFTVGVSLHPFMRRKWPAESVYDIIVLAVSITDDQDMDMKNSCVFLSISDCEYVGTGVLGFILL